MGAICSNDVGAVNKDPNLIIDVEKVLTETTWRNFVISRGKFERRFLKRKNYAIEVPMQYYHFKQVDSQLTGTTRREEGATGLSKGNTSHLAGKGLAHSDQTSPTCIGLQTIFNNDTDERQTYTFNFEKVRTAAVEVTYQRGFSIGAKANFSVGLPKVMGDGSIGCEIDKQLQVTKATGERFEESLKTSASSDIVVSPKSRYIASVVMEEKTLLANFKTVVEMSMPAGKAPMYVKDLRTGEIVHVRIEHNLPRLFRNFKDVWSEVKDANGRRREDRVRFTVEGIVDGVQLSTHNINLYCDASIPPSPKVFSEPTDMMNGKMASIEETEELASLKT